MRKKKDRRTGPWNAQADPPQVDLTDDLRFAVSTDAIFEADIRQASSLDHSGHLKIRIRSNIDSSDFYLDVDPVPPFSPSSGKT